MKLFNTLAKKLAAVTLVVAAATTMSVTAISGFGPDRPTKAWDPTVNGFDYVTFNSFTGVGNGIGDERDFLRGSVVGSQNNWSDPVEAAPDQSEVEVKIYIHNNADASLNDSGDGVARDVNVRVSVPEDSAQSQDLTSWISASNAQPQTIYDTLTVNGENNGYLELDFVPGSAKLHNGNDVVALSDALFAGGVNIGDQNGCFEYTREITFRVKVNMPNYSISKQVKVTGSEDTWTETVEADPADTISWLITFNNIGNTELKNVKIVDNIPEGLTVVPGSVKLTNGNYPQGYVYPDTAIQADGRQVNVDIGNYNPGILAYVTFRTVYAEAEELECGSVSLRNVAFATPAGYGSITDDSRVNIDTGIECEDPEFELSCEVLDLKAIVGKKDTYRIEVKPTVDPSEAASVKTVEIVITDPSGNKSVSDKLVIPSHTFKGEGQHTVDATIEFAIAEGYDKEADNTVTCKALIDVKEGEKPKEPPVTVITKTGPGTNIALIAAVVVASTYAYRVYAGRMS